MYYCFLDLECTCGFFGEYLKKERYCGEPLSLGIAILNSKMKIVDSFYTTIKPYRFPVVTKFCRKLTGLTQADIDDAPSTGEVCTELETIFEKYHIEEIYVYGNNDKKSLLDAAEQFAKNFPPTTDKIAHLHSIILVASKIVDISSDLQLAIKYKHKPSLEAFSELLKLKKDSASFHNALYDAKMLAMIYAAIYGNGKSHQVFLKYLKSLPEKNDAEIKKTKETHENQ